MADQPPDPSAHAQVHDWAEERGLQTVDLLRLGFVCPKCYCVMGTHRRLDCPGKVLIWHGPASNCVDANKEWLVNAGHLIQRFPCEILEPAEVPTP